MNTKEIIENAIIETAIQCHASTRDAIRWAIQKERGACALVAEYEAAKRPESRELCEFIAAAIRARGNE